MAHGIETEAGAGLKRYKRPISEFQRYRQADLSNDMRISRRKWHKASRIICYAASQNFIKYKL